MATIDDEIAQASDEFPVLGYTVIATLKGVEVRHDELLRLLTPPGLARYLPALPEPRTSLKRAIRAWLKELATAGPGWLAEEDDEDLRTRRLVREISAARSPLLTLALVAENADLSELGLSYLTNLRVCLDRTTDTLNLTTTPAGQDAVRQTALQDQALLAGLVPHWAYYRDVHTGGDLGRMVHDIIAGLDASPMRAGGGVYFVPYAQRPALRALKHLLAALPAAPGQENASSLVHLPILDRPAIKRQMAAIAHRSFMSELVALQKDLERFVQQAQAVTRSGKQGRIKSQSMVSRLADYQAMKARVALYGEMMEMRQQEILRGLEQLQTTARTLLETAAGALSADDPEAAAPAATSIVADRETASAAVV
jgi:hypothetical protein